jgi:hypothetical protein
MAIYSVVSVTTTWGPPLIGGVASQGPAGFSLQFTILSAFFVVTVPAIALGVPETTFDRTFTIAQTPATAASQFKAPFSPTPWRLFSIDAVTDYIVKLKPYAYNGSADMTILLQAPRALVTPTTALLALTSFLPSSTLWGLATSLSLLFHPLPFNLPASTIGALFLAPLLLSTVATILPTFLPPLFQTQQPRLTRLATHQHTLTLATGAALSLTGLLTFGLHLSTAMTPPAPAANNTTSLFAPTYLPPRANLPAASFALGLLAAGAALLDAAAAPLIQQSTAFTGANLAVATRNTADMAGAVACWRALGHGVFVLAVPSAVWWWDGLRGFCVAVGVVGAVVVGVAAGVWWAWGEGVRRWDGRVMGLVDLEGLRRTGSFFDLD